MNGNIPSDFVRRPREGSAAERTENYSRLEALLERGGVSIVSNWHEVDPIDIARVYEVRSRTTNMNGAAQFVSESRNTPLSETRRLCALESSICLIIILADDQQRYIAHLTKDR